VVPDPGIAGVAVDLGDLSADDRGELASAGWLIVDKDVDAVRDIFNSTNSARLQ
jgi:hypothetical protein